MIGSQPATFAAMIALSPTPPTANTAMLWPGWASSARSTVPAPVWTPQPSGPSNSIGASSGTFTALRSVAMECVAKEDWQKKCEWTGCPFWLIAVEPSSRTPVMFSGSIWKQ